MRIAALILIVTLSMSFMTSPAEASASAAGSPGQLATRNPTKKVVTVPLTVRCKVKSPPAERVQDLSQFCTGQAATTLSVKPQNQVPGNCGTSFLYIWNYGRGHAGFEMGATSILGPIAYGSATIGWYNATRNHVGTPFHEPVSGNLEPNKWLKVEDVITASGDVFGDLYGDVIVGDTICSIDHPTDSQYITDY